MCESNSQTFQPIGLEQQEVGRLEEQSEEQRLRSKYNQTLAINRLPFEVMEMILNELPLNDLLACERVCQHWNDYVRNLNIRRMIIAKVLPDVYKSKIRPRKWFFIETNDWWPRKEMLRSDLNIDLSNSFLLNLRQLRVCDPTIKHLYKAPNHLLKDTNFINQLIHLEVLEISGIDEGTIDLPNLTCLAIHRLVSSRVRIDCPKLTSFRTKQNVYYLELPQFLHPQTIMHLYASYYSPAFTIFHSLVYLSLDSSAFHRKYSNNDTDQFLTAFPKLRVLSQRPGGKRGFNELNLRELLRRKNALKRHDLRILYFGIPIDDPAQLEESNEFRLLMRNYEKRWPDELKRERSISYPQLMASVNHRPEQLPADIQRTFCNVQQVIVDRPQDEDALLRFLAGFRKLRIMYFKTSSWLSEVFFENLAIACPPSSHKCLELHFNESLASFDFIFKFRNLVSLRLFKGAFVSEFIRRVFDEFGTFELFFYPESIPIPPRITISRRDRRSSFDCSYLDKYLSFDSLDDLLQGHPERIEAIRRSLALKNLRKKPRNT